MVLERLREERTLYDVLMSRALRLASATLAHVDSRAGGVRPGNVDAARRHRRRTTRTSTLETLRALLQMIEEKARLVRLLDDYIGADGLTVVIGSEHPSNDLQRFSLVFSTYSDGRGTGAVGVIGPTRMHYSRAINAVDSLSRVISRVVGAKT